MAIRTTHYPSGAKRRCGLFTKSATGVHRKDGLVGGLNESVQTPADRVYFLDTLKAKRQRLKEEKRQRARAYMTLTQEFQLWYGDAKFGKPRTMSGQEARDKNVALEQKLFADKNPDARLWRWIPAHCDHVNKGTTWGEYRQQKFDEMMASESATTVA